MVNSKVPLLSSCYWCCPGTHRTKCTHGLYYSNIPALTQRTSAQRTHQSSPHFHHRKTTNGYGFSQGLHSVHGWAHFQHEQLLQTGNTQNLHLPLCCSASAQVGRQPGMTASCTDPAVQCIWTSSDGWLKCEVVSLSSSSSVPLANCMITRSIFTNQPKRYYKI